MIKVRMLPHLTHIEKGSPSGVQKVIEKYFQYLPQFDVELVKPSATSYDLLAIHAGAFDSYLPGDPVIAHCHGLYWTDDYESKGWELEGNKTVIEILRQAVATTVPSRWVAEAIQRDMHFMPTIVPHGVEWAEWQGGQDEGYILWNKNRDTDVCDPTPVNELAKLLPKTQFITTYAADKPPRNVRVLGTVPHEEMKSLIKNASLYLATTKETFGIGTLEALAAGVPVLGFDHGGTADLVLHGRTGYLAQPGDYDDLVHGANYLLRHRKPVSERARDFARLYGWQNAVRQVAQVYADAVAALNQPARIGVVIPCYNKQGTLARAVESARSQSRPPDEIIIVDNNSTDGSREEALRLLDKFRGDSTTNFTLLRCQQQGVAHARNAGIEALADCPYIVCLDADDEIKPEFIETCANALVSDRSLAIAYTSIEAVREDGHRFTSAWPGEYNFDEFMAGRNQVPTCCMFCREMWRRAGGYRQRFAPTGAGSEDADLWLRIGALGGRGEKVSEEPLFIYYLGGYVSGNPNYHEVNWRSDKPWIEDGRHPFASLATPANKVSHLVRQADHPLISVVVPVGPKHGQFLSDCLDSVEAQTCRQWEVIVVADTDNLEYAAIAQRIADGHPFVRLLRTARARSGAGVARNLGATHARAPFLVFLDADDTLSGNALNALLAGYREYPHTVVYGDYIGHAYLEAAEATRLRSAGRLLQYDEGSKLAQVVYHALDYDCEKALAQPNARQPYIWNIISSLVPTAFHREIHGFDEAMESWEDWDYWLRLARAGKCFTRIPNTILEYKFYTGGRRALANPTESGENGRQLSEHLLGYMQNKYEGMETMPCRSCGGGRSRKPTALQTPVMVQSLSEGNTGKMAGSDLVWVKLIDGNVGTHRVIFRGENYGYRTDGEYFKMRGDHAALDNRVRAVSEKEAQEAMGIPVTDNGSSAPISTHELLNLPPTPKRTLPPPEPEDDFEDDSKDELPASVAVTEADEDSAVDAEANTLGLGSTITSARIVTPEDGTPTTLAPEEGITFVQPKAIFDFTQVWGIGAERQAVLLNAGVRSLTGLIAQDVPGIQKLLGVPEKTAERILKSATEQAAK